jgi:allophanate hydrolase subunit 1
MGRPLADDRVAATVEAVAHAIAERTGVPVIDLSSSPASITVTLQAPRLAAIGFAAELRRVTNRWHQEKHGGPLWREPETPDDPFSDLREPPDL